MSKERNYKIFFGKKCPSGIIEITCHYYDDKEFIVKLLKDARKAHPEYEIKDIFVRTYIKGANKFLSEEIR